MYIWKNAEFIHNKGTALFVLVKKSRPDKRKGVTPRTLSIIYRRGVHSDKTCNYQKYLDRYVH